MPSATVIGAGPAGSTAALLLARAGWDVTLVEQHPFPRHKVCGECLSHLGYQVLRRLNLGKAFHAAGARPLTRTLLFDPEGRPAQLSLPNPMWGLSRHRLDSLLLQAATDAGATLLQPHRCECIVGTTATLRDLRTNTTRTLAADFVILADGRRSLTSRPPPTGDLGIKAHFESVQTPDDAISLFSLPGHYLGLAPIERPLFNVAYSVPATRVRAAAGDLKSLFRELLSENAAMAEAFAGARRVTAWLASPLPRFAVADGLPPGVIAVGNAAASIEPIGGEGMGLALRSAELAAAALIEAGPDPRHPALRRLTRDYHQLWRTRRPACRTGAVVLSRPKLARAAVDLLTSVPGIGAPPLQWIGK